MTGLVAARTLADSGIDVSLYEAAGRLGGQVCTIDFADRRIDVGAEAMHTAAPQVESLICALGLADEVVAAKPGTPWIATSRGLRRLPAGVGPAGPTKLRPVIETGILPPSALARAALEPLIGAVDLSHDMSVGELISRRFGRGVVDNLIDPLLGSLHAGDVDTLSVKAATPQIAAMATAHRSLLAAHRTRRATGTGQPPSFISFTAGLNRLAEALTDHTRLTVHTDTTVVSLREQGGLWNLGSDIITAHDTVVLATPAHVTARLTRPFASTAAGLIGELRSATVATVIAAYDRRQVTSPLVLGASGLLIPSARRGVLKAATFLSNKWPQLADRNRFFVRMSAGTADDETIAEMDDDDLVAKMRDELAGHVGLGVTPDEAVVVRWPRSLAQLEIGHLDRIAKIRSELSRHPGIVIAGAPYEGIGIASCIRSGQRAASMVLEHLNRRADRPR